MPGCAVAALPAIRGCMSRSRQSAPPGSNPRTQADRCRTLPCRRHRRESTVCRWRAIWRSEVLKSDDERLRYSVSRGKFNPVADTVRYTVDRTRPMLNVVLRCRLQQSDRFNLTSPNSITKMSRGLIAFGFCRLIPDNIRISVESAADRV